TPDGADANFKILIWGRGCLPYSSGRNLHVLLGECTDHVARGELASRHADRVEPDAHRVLALAEDEDVSYALNSFQSITNIYVEIVADEQAVVAIVFCVEASAKNEVVCCLHHADARRLHFIRHAPKSLINPVLHVHGRDVNVAIQIEDDADAGAAIVA